MTIALNSALHHDKNIPVPGPFKKVFTMSRYKFFLWAFGAMFVYFWFPNYLFEALTYFSWMTWISPENLNLNILTGFQNGLGVSLISLEKKKERKREREREREREGDADDDDRCSTRGRRLIGMLCFTMRLILW